MHKTQKRQRKEFLTAVLGHARDFNQWHRQRKREYKKFADIMEKKKQVSGCVSRLKVSGCGEDPFTGLVKERDKQGSEEERQQKERIRALKAQDQEEYIR